MQPRDLFPDTIKEGNGEKKNCHRVDTEGTYRQGIFSECAWQDFGVYELLIMPDLCVCVCVCVCESLSCV